MTPPDSAPPTTADAGASSVNLPRWRSPAWVERIAESRYAVPFMGLLTFLDACVSPILPEVLLIPLCLARPARRWFYAFFCGVMSVAGAAVGYYIGYGLWEAGGAELAYEWLPGFTPEVFADVSSKFGSNGFVWILIAAFTPLPFKVFTVAAGVCHHQVSIETLVLASIVGRLPRFWLEVALIHRFGPGVVDVLRRPLWATLFILVSIGAIVYTLL